MASLITKRQQARNEKALQDLISTVAGNERCADCSARNPGWASWSLGIFLCMRCAALHRKLGTHVSKVKSLSMDSWNSEQVDTMKRVGNTTSNRTFNPKNVKPQIPADVDEADGVMERFIRQKYEQRAFVSGQKPVHIQRGSISSDEQPPPPLPPKPGKKFGFGLRSTSSTTARQERPTPPLSPAYTGSNGSSSPAKANKQSRVLGSVVGNQEDDFDAKLAALRDMGFKDTRRNSSILKSLSGNLDRTVEALVRIGETEKPPSGTITPVSASSVSNGISVQKQRAPTAANSMNPFDALDMQPPQRSSTMPQQPAQAQQMAGASYYAGPNNMLQEHQQQQQGSFQSLQGQMNNLNISQPQSSMLSPASTGAYNPFLAQGPVSPAPQNYNSFNQAPSSMQSPTYVTQETSSNPFLRRVQSQTFTQPSPWGQQDSLQRAQSPATNPWQNMQAQAVQSPQLYSPAASMQQSGYFVPAFNGTPTVQSPNNPFQNQSLASPQNGTPTNLYQQPFQPPLPLPHSPNPYAQMQSPGLQPPQAHQQYAPHSQNTFPPPTQPASPFRHDKSSILALYSQPHLAPQSASQSTSPVGQEQPPPAQRSVTMPVQASAGNMNPFAAQNGQASYTQGQAGDGAQQQDAFSGLMPQRW